MVRKNITVSIPEHVYRLSRIRAAELSTSVSSLVRDFLEELAREPANQSGKPMETEKERRERILNEVFREICETRSGFKASDNLSRAELYGGHDEVR